MEKFTWRYADKEDYNLVLVKWWKEWGFPVPPAGCLPQRGVMVSDAGGDLYGGYLYVTDGGIGWLEWVVSDRKAAVARKRGALEFLTEVLASLAREAGMKMVFTSTVLPGFVNGLKQCGFEVGDRNIVQLIKMI